AVVKVVCTPVPMRRPKGLQQGLQHTSPSPVDFLPEGSCTTPQDNLSASSEDGVSAFVLVHAGRELSRVARRRNAASLLLRAGAETVASLRRPRDGRRSAPEDSQIHLNLRTSARAFPSRFWASPRATRGR